MAKKNTRETSQNFNPEISFFKSKMEKEKENYHTALLFQACENIIPLCFECSMCLLCFSHLEETTRKTAAGIWMWIEKAKKMEAKNSAAQRNVIYFLGKMKMSVRAWDIRRFVSLFGLWFAFISFRFCVSLAFYLRRAWGGKGLKRFHDNNPRLARWYIFVSTSLTETFLLKSRSMKILEMSRNVWTLSWEKFHAVESYNFAVCNLIFLLAQFAPKVNHPII